MRLDLGDTLSLLDRLLECEPPVAKPAGFTLRVRRLRDLLSETGNSELSVAAIAGFVFPGVSQNSLRTTLLEFRKSLRTAAKAAGIEIDLVHPDARGTGSAEVACHFEGAPLPVIFDNLAAGVALRREIEVIEPRARATKIFVSFATKDTKLSKEFTDQLKENLPLRFQEPVQLWRFDETGGLLPGEDNSEIIQARMNESQFGILLVSPTYLSRPFIQEVEMPHFLGKTARAHPIPVALADFDPRKDKHPLLDKANVFSHNGKDYYRTDKKNRGEFIKALCDHIVELISKYPSPPVRTLTDSENEFLHLCPIVRNEDGVYIPGKGRSESSLAKPATRADGDSSEGSVPVLETLHAWYADPNASGYMALLGQTGAGKTMTCSKLARELNARRPGSCLYIDLRHLNESGLLQDVANPTLIQILAAILSRGGSAETIAPERLLQAIREKGALLIWDGLDEVLVHLSTLRGNALFSQLKSALPAELFHKSKGTSGRLLFACRTQFFSNFEHEASSLTGNQRDAINATASASQRTRFQVLRLLPFDDNQIRAYLNANLPGLDLERAIVVIQSVHNLHDLARRPYCLSLIRTFLPELDRELTAGRKFRSVDLYRSLVRSWLIRDSGKHRFEEDDKPRLMACLAAWMWREGAKSLSSERLGTWLKETLISDSTFRALYADDLKESEKRDRLLQDFRTATFIARWDGDSFRFAHTSLQEYFLATHLIRALEEAQPDGWSLPQVNRETLDFASELFLQRSGESPAAKQRLESTLGMLLGGSVPGRSENALAFYVRLHATGELHWIPEKFDFRNLEFTAWEFIGTKENPLRLPQVDFSGGTLIRVRFHHVELIASRWHCANLCSAEFLGCILESADFASEGNGKTCLEGVRMRECQISDSKITGAILDGLRIELPRWDVPTEELWHTKLREYQVLPEPCISAKWTAPLPTGSTSPLLAGANLLLLPSAQWSSGHRGSVMCVAYFPDGRRIASGSRDRSIRIWDADSGVCIRVLEGHTEGVWQLAISPNGRLLASASDDGPVRLWDADTGLFLRTLEGLSGYATSVAFTPDGLHIFSGTSNYRVGIWDAESGECLKAFEMKRQDSSFFGGTLALANDGKVASSVNIKSIIVWGGNRGELFLNGHTGQICSMAFSPDSKKLVSGAYENSARVWDSENGDCLLVLDGHSGHVRTVCFSPDGTRILSGSEDNSLRIWDTKTGRCLRMFSGLSDSVIAAAFSPNANRIAVGSGMSVQIWDVELGTLIREIKGRHNWISCTAFSNGGSKIATGCYFDWVSIWDISTGRRIQRFEGHGKSVSSVALSPDDSLIASGSGTGVIRICNIVTGRTVHTIEAHSEYIYGLVFSPDGSRLASASTDKTVKIWEIETGALIHTLKGNVEIITKLVYSADGRWVLGCHKNGNHPEENTSVCVWDSHTGILHQTFPGHRNSADNVAISPDSRLIISSSVYDSICVWNFETAQCLFTIENQGGRVTDLAFSPDGSRILIKSSDNIIRGWDSKTGLPSAASEADEHHLIKGSSHTGFNLLLSPAGTVRTARTDGIELDIEQQRDGDYAVLEKISGQSQWRLCRAKGEYWRYVNYATDGPEGRVLWSADALGSVPEA